MASWDGWVCWCRSYSRQDERRHRAAQSSAASPAVLRRLARDSVLYIREAAIANPNTSPETLRQTVEGPAQTAGLKHWFTGVGIDSDYWLCRVAATNPACPPDILVRLGRSNDLGLRRLAAGNPSLPIEQTQSLLRDPDPWVAQAAADNPGLPAYLRAMWQLTTR
jgi:hypothetical protein